MEPFRTTTGKIQAFFWFCAIAGWIVYAALEIVSMHGSYMAPGIAITTKTPNVGVQVPGFIMCPAQTQPTGTLPTPFDSVTVYSCLPGQQVSGNSSAACATITGSPSTWYLTANANTADNVYYQPTGSVITICLVFNPAQVNYTKPGSYLAIVYNYAKCGYTNVNGNSCPSTSTDWGNGFFFSVWTGNKLANGQPVIGSNPALVDSLGLVLAFFTQTVYVPYNGAFSPYASPIQPYSNWTMNVQSVRQAGGVSSSGIISGGQLVVAPSSYSIQTSTEFIAFGVGQWFGVVGGMLSSILAAYAALVGAGPYNPYGLLQTMVLPKLAPHEVPADLKAKMEAESAPASTNGNDAATNVSVQLTVASTSVPDQEGKA